MGYTVSSSPALTIKGSLPVMLNISSQLGRIQNHVGDKLLGMSVRKFLDSVGLGGKNHPENRWHHAIAESQRKGWQPAGVCFLVQGTVSSCIPLCGCHAFTTVTD